jgi:hypothetical protein
VWRRADAACAASGSATYAAHALDETSVSGIARNNSETESHFFIAL